MTEETKGKRKDKRLEEKDKLDPEIARSLSVAKMKQVHKQIEDIEKLRKQSAIRSICERIGFCHEMSKVITDSIDGMKQESPNLKLDVQLPDGAPMKKYLDNIVVMYDSIRFDFQRNADINQEAFDKLFPRIEPNFNVFASVAPNLRCMIMQLVDMK